MLRSRKIWVLGVKSFQLAVSEVNRKVSDGFRGSFVFVQLFYRCNSVWSQNHFDQQYSLKFGRLNHQVDQLGKTLVWNLAILYEKYVDVKVDGKFCSCQLENPPEDIHPDMLSPVLVFYEKPSLVDLVEQWIRIYFESVVVFFTVLNELIDLRIFRVVSLS